MEICVMTDQECEDILDNISCDEPLTLEGEIIMSPTQQNQLVKYITCQMIIMMTYISTVLI